jgi:hypothetical protein
LHERDDSSDAAADDACDGWPTARPHHNSAIRGDPAQKETMRLVVAAALLHLCAGCSGVVVQSGSGVIENPVPPTSSYGNAETCTWILLARNNRDVVLQFEFFESQSQNDVLHVYDVTSSGDKLIGRLLGSVTVRAVARGLLVCCVTHHFGVVQDEPKFASTGGNLTVTWVSDASGVADGFRASWKSSIVVHVSQRTQRTLRIARAVGAAGAVIVFAILVCVFRKRILRLFGRVFRKDIERRLAKLAEEDAAANSPAASPTFCLRPNGCKGAPNLRLDTDCLQMVADFATEMDAGVLRIDS